MSTSRRGLAAHRHNFLRLGMRQTWLPGCLHKPPALSRLDPKHDCRIVVVHQQFSVNLFSSCSSIVLKYMYIYRHFFKVPKSFDPPIQLSRQLTELYERKEKPNQTRTESTWFEEAYRASG